MSGAAGYQNIGPTRPMTRAERRAEDARIRAEQERSETEAPPQTPTPTATPATPTITLQARPPAKRPFSTQLTPRTLARLEWLRARGYIINDTVDTAINTYLNAAGIPDADEHGTITEPNN
ncbi:hypothetical protein [Nocardia testacea]|uniref:hypothetical protein n=1 Tax=Nocardia testacea TaxID=248551 RepID=UPI0033C319A2